MLNYLSGLFDMNHEIVTDDKIETDQKIATNDKNLLFLIDSTGSMEYWIRALIQSLPSICQGISLTQLFDRIGIFSYTDYDQYPICNFSGFADVTNETAVNNLREFAANLNASGGGGGPEAWKTAILSIADIKIAGRIYIIHLTDQGPHVTNNLNREGFKERQALGDKFDYIVLENIFLRNVNNLRYTCLTTLPHPFYCHLAQKTESCVYSFNSEICPNEIRKAINQILNKWIGLDDQITNSRTIDPELIDTFKLETDLASTEIIVNLEPEKTDKILSTSLINAIKKMRYNPEFIEFIINKFKAIIMTEPMTLTVSSILGKMWREFCKRRSDVRRDELISLLNKAKTKLGQVERDILDKWLTESYDSNYEIKSEIYAYISQNETQGLIRFATDMDKVILKGFPEEILLSSQKIVHLLNMFSTKSFSIIRAILSRIYIDTNYLLPMVKSDFDDDDNIPLPSNSIPLNLSINKIFELLMHIVVPGTKLTKRYAAIMALHIMQYGGTLLPFAKNFLNKNRGKNWINWKIREDGTPENTECWTYGFLNLILHPECQFALTSDELNRATNLRQISYLLRFYRQLEVTLKVVDNFSMDSSREEHLVLCQDCGCHRPLSLMTQDGNCGYCHWGLIRINIQYSLVKCHCCGSFYSRNRTAIVEGKSRCHNCRKDSAASPRSKCGNCGYDYVNFYQPEIGLPDGKCKSCSLGLSVIKASYRDILTYADKIFSKETFNNLCATLGFKINDDVNASTAIYKIENSVSIIDKQPLRTINDTYYGSSIENRQYLSEYMLKVMSGDNQLTPDCAICFGQFRPDKLTPSCGRRNCNYRICIDCCRSWYGSNSPGNLICQRACLCQFCSRVPAPKVLYKINPQLISLVKSIDNNSLIPDTYYGWCSQCLNPKEICQVECTNEAPKLKEYKCLACNDTRPKLETKDCPNCTVCTMKTEGCNHILCTSCHTHWCWECSTRCDSHQDTYSHMWGKHGRIFMDESPIDMEAENDMDNVD